MSMAGVFDPSKNRLPDSGFGVREFLSSPKLDVCSHSLVGHLFQCVVDSLHAYDGMRTSEEEVYHCLKSRGQLSVSPTRAESLTSQRNSPRSVWRSFPPVERTNF